MEEITLSAAVLLPHFPFRVGDYRIGVIVEDDTMVFVRCLHRREIYRYFP